MGLENLAQTQVRSHHNAAADQHERNGGPSSGNTHRSPGIASDGPEPNGGDEVGGTAQDKDSITKEANAHAVAVGGGTNDSNEE